jgi:hypothetical protein
LPLAASNPKRRMNESTKNKKVKKIRQKGEVV